MENAVAHQLGMAMALCSFGAEMVQKHDSVLRELSSPEDLEQERRIFQDHADRSESIAGELGMREAAMQARSDAEETYRSMHDTFFENMTEDASHVIQWMAMTHAAGLSIWAELSGAAETMDNDSLRELSDEALQFQRQSLESVEQLQTELGQKTAKQA